MIQLDERLGSMTRQHVEHQGNESSSFLRHFKVVTNLNGESVSTDNQAAIKASFMETRLYVIQVAAQKKRRTLRLVQLPCRRESLRSDSVFVLNVPTVHSWLWRGCSSNLQTLTHTSFCSSLFQNENTDSKLPKMDVTILEEGVNDGDEASKFWKYIPSAKDKPFIPTLYKICEDDKLEEVGRGSKTPFGNPEHQERLLLSSSLLKGEFAYLFDTGSHIFIWWGLGTVGFDKQWRAFPIADQYFQDFNRPTLPVTVLKQGEEVPSFSKHFHFFTQQAIVAASNKDQANRSVLYHIKGTIKHQSISVHLVPCRCDSLNKGDVFVLTTTEKHIWLWRGSSSNADERGKGLELAQSFASQRGLQVSTLDQGKDDVKANAEFWKHLLPGKIKEADECDDIGVSFVPTLFKVCFEQKLRSIARDFEPFSRSTLRSEDIHLLDTGFHVFLWWGLSSEGVESDRWKSFSLANQYFRDYKRPTLPITIVLEGNSEPATFKQHFHLIRPTRDSSCCNIL